MNLSLKKDLVAAFLAIMLVWPVVQMGIAKGYNINAWKFFAWGMYSKTPVILDLVELGAMSKPGGPPVAPPTWSADTKEATQAFLDDRKWWGDLVSPDPIAEAALRDHPELYGIEMRITRHEVNPKTSRIEATPTFYTYPREVTE